MSRKLDARRASRIRERTGLSHAALAASRTRQHTSRLRRASPDGTTIASGATLQLGNGTTSGTITGAVSNLGTLVFNEAAPTTFAGTITGAGTISVISAAAPLTFTGPLSGVQGLSPATGAAVVLSGTSSVTDSSNGIGTGPSNNAAIYARASASALTMFLDDGLGLGWFRVFR